MDGLMQPRPLTIAHILERAERLYAHKQVVTAGTERVTYADVAEQTRRLATALDSLGVPAGARVATFASNTRRHLELYLALPVTKRVLHSINIRLSAEHLEYVVNHAGDDADEVVSNPRGCRFDPHALRCPDGADTGPGCLSDPQIGAVTAMSTPFRWPYRIASGETGYPGFPFLSGADMRTPFLGFGTTAPANPMPVTSGYGMQYWDQWVKHFLTRDPGFNSLDLDPRRPGRWLDRISHLSTIQDRNDVDLGPFARSGGKLLLLHGAADELVSHRSTNDYHQRVRDLLGPERTQRFLRYYLVPGANHANVGTPAFAAGWDSLSALERWAGKGQPPENPVVADVTHNRTRPLCEYPGWPRYRAGDPDTAASFVCTR